MTGSTGREPEPDAVTLGHVVARRRKRLGFTQTDLAQKAGLSPSAIYIIESGSRPVRRSTQRKVAEALGMTLEDLVSEALEESAAVNGVNHVPEGAVMVAPQGGAPSGDVDLSALGSRYVYRVLADGMPGVQLVILSDRELTDEEQAEAWKSRPNQ